MVSELHWVRTKTIIIQYCCSSKYSPTTKQNTSEFGEEFFMQKGRKMNKPYLKYKMQKNPTY